MEVFISNCDFLISSETAYMGRPARFRECKHLRMSQQSARSACRSQWGMWKTLISDSKVQLAFEKLSLVWFQNGVKEEYPQLSEIRKHPLPLLCLFTAIYHHELNEIDLKLISKTLKPHLKNICKSVPFRLWVPRFLLTFHKNTLSFMLICDTFIIAVFLSGLIFWKISRFYF